MLRVIHGLILAMWVAIFFYWMVSAARVKPNIAPAPYFALPLRLLILVLIVVAVRTPQLRQWLRHAQAPLASHRLIPIGGLILCALGLTLALSARIHLGRNWGMPMSRKLQPELVTSGPYAYARHPIYGGMLLGMLGSALGMTVFWVLPLVLFGPYFIGSARREEKLMLSLFPTQYDAYRRRTKMLIPFVI